MTGRRRRHVKVVLTLAIGLVLTGLSVVAYEMKAFNRLELDTVDARFDTRGEQPAPRDVVVVGIDDVSFDELRTRWPFPRGYHARVIDQLRRAGADVIAYDVQFTEPSRDPSQDLALFNAARRAGNVVFATTEANEQGGTNVLGGDANLRKARARVGNGLMPNDPGGVIRRVDPAFDGLESFSFVAERMANPGRSASLPAHTAWIDFPGPAGTIEAVPFSRVYEGRFNPAQFRGKTVVVGPVAPTLQDVHPVSTGGEDLMSGAEIQAAAIATLRAGDPLGSAPGWLNVLVIVLLGMLIPLASLRLRPLMALLVAVLTGAAYLVIAQLAFNGGTILTLVYPICALVLTTIGAFVVHYFTEARERRRLRALFGRFVPEAVVDTVVDRAEDDLRLVGEELDCTVVFTDLRGFTSFSEQLPPPQVFDILTDYHEEMTQAVLDNGGTLVSYMGDGLMAVFGAPIPQPDHADRALRAGLEMVGPRLDAFNVSLRKQGHPEFRMGVGLNSGPVMSGNVGSSRRLEYTTIGDTVNTAARIESLTKDYEHMLLMSGSTRVALTDPGEQNLLLVGETPIRGREQTIELWTIGPSGFERDGTPGEATAEFV